MDSAHVDNQLRSVFSLYCILKTSNRLNSQPAFQRQSAQAICGFGLKQRVSCRFQPDGLLRLASSSAQKETFNAHSFRSSNFRYFQ